MDHQHNPIASLLEVPWVDVKQGHMIYTSFGGLQLAFLTLAFALPGLAIVGSFFLPPYKNGACLQSVLQLYWLVFILFFILPPLGIVLPVDIQTVGMLRIMWLTSIAITLVLLLVLRCTGRSEDIRLYPIGPLMRNLCGRLLWPILDTWNYFLVQISTESFPYPIPCEYVLREAQIEEFRKYLINFPLVPQDDKLAQWSKSTGYMYSLFDSLPAVEASTMYQSKFRGQSFPVSIMGRLLNSFKLQNWGKAFADEYSGDPLIVWFGTSAMPLPLWGNVLMQDLTNRGVLTATMTYQGYPWQDHFRYLGVNDRGHRVFLGNWEINGQLGGFFKLTDTSSSHSLPSSASKRACADASEKNRLLDEPLP